MRTSSGTGGWVATSQRIDGIGRAERLTNAFRSTRDGCRTSPLLSSYAPTRHARHPHQVSAALTQFLQVDSIWSVQSEDVEEEVGGGGAGGGAGGDDQRLSHLRREGGRGGWRREGEGTSKGYINQGCAKRGEGHYRMSV